MLVKAPPQDSASRIANRCKGYTLRVLRAECPHPRPRLPTLRSRSYFAATAGAGSAAAVQRYLGSQYGATVARGAVPVRRAHRFRADINGAVNIASRPGWA